jgi:hypothetical protein
MNMPGFMAEASLYKSLNRYSATTMEAQKSASIYPQSPPIYPLSDSPISDCVCCILSDSYSCCARCVNYILGE